MKSPHHTSSSVSGTSRSSRRQQGGGGSRTTRRPREEAKDDATYTSFAEPASQESRSQRSRGRKSSQVSVSSRSFRSHNPRKSSSNNFQNQDTALQDAIDSMNKSTVNNSPRTKDTPSEATRSKIDDTLHQGAYPEAAYNDFKNAKDQIPAMIYTPPRDGNPSFSAKSCKIFVAPENPEQLASFCFLPVGEGSTFCLNRNCSTNHRGNGECVPVLPGEVFIMSDRTKAFKEPSSNSLLWDNGLYQTWIKDPIPVLEWIERFKLIKNQMDVDPNSAINHNSLIDEAISTQKVKNFQSVRKRKKPQDSTFEPIQFSLGQDFTVKPESGFTIESVAQAITVLETSLRNVINQIQSMNSFSQDFRDFVEPSLIQGEQSILDLNTTIGSRPSFIPPQFDSPTLWTTLGLMSSELLSVSNQATFNFTKWETDTKLLASEAAKRTFSKEQQDIHKTINLMNESIIAVTRKLRELLEAKPSPPSPSSHQQNKKVFHEKTKFSTPTLI